MRPGAFLALITDERDADLDDGQRERLVNLDGAVTSVDMTREERPLVHLLEFREIQLPQTGKRRRPRTTAVSQLGEDGVADRRGSPVFLGERLSDPGIQLQPLVKPYQIGAAVPGGEVQNVVEG